MQREDSPDVGPLRVVVSLAMNIFSAPRSCTTRSVDVPPMSLPNDEPAKSLSLSRPNARLYQEWARAGRE